MTGSRLVKQVENTSWTLCFWWLMFRQPTWKPSSESSELWRWLLHRLSKRWLPTTVLLNTPVTHMMLFNQGVVLLLGSNHFLNFSLQIQRVKLNSPMPRMVGCSEGVSCAHCHKAVNAGVEEHIIVVATSCAHILWRNVVWVCLLQKAKINIALSVVKGGLRKVTSWPVWWL